MTVKMIIWNFRNILSIGEPKIALTEKREVMTKSMEVKTKKKNFMAPFCGWGRQFTFYHCLLVTESLE